MNCKRVSRVCIGSVLALSVGGAVAQDIDYFLDELHNGEVVYYSPDGGYYDSSHRPYFRLDHLSIPKEVAPGQIVNGAVGWTVVGNESQNAIVYKTLLAEWAPLSPIAFVQNGELDGPPRSENRTFSFTAPTTPGVYRIRLASVWAFQSIDNFYGEGPRGDASNPGVGDFAEVIVTVMSDCNGNSVPDVEDIATGFSSDCDGNGLPDECEPDCDDDGIPDNCDTDNQLLGDVDGDGDVDITDLGLVLSNFGRSCPQP